MDNINFQKCKKLYELYCKKQYPEPPQWLSGTIPAAKLESLKFVAPVKAAKQPSVTVSVFDSEPEVKRISQAMLEEESKKGEEESDFSLKPAKKSTVDNELDKIDQLFHSSSSKSKPTDSSNKSIVHQQSSNSSKSQTIAESKTHEKTEQYELQNNLFKISEDDTTK